MSCRTKFFLDKEIEDTYSMRLSVDRMSAIQKMSEIEDIYKELPHLDCGSCGAPNCHALAADIVEGEAEKRDCLIRLREYLEKREKK